MTMLVRQPERDEQISEPDPTVWRSVQAGIWVGHREGAFAGMIEQRWGDGFLVTTRLGRSLGTYPTMQEARQALR